MKIENNLFYKKIISTKFGEMIAIASEAELKLLEFTTRKKLEEKISALEKRTSWKIQEGKNLPLLLELEKELREYFEGSRQQFTVPFNNSFGTNFQKKVWKELKKIPYGETISYKTLAKRAGNEKAYRAVALANASNIFAVLVPCHRVISSSGAPGGYAGGVEKKKNILALENNFIFGDFKNYVKSSTNDSRKKQSNQ